MSDDYNRPEFVQEAMNELPPEDVLQMFVSAGCLFPKKTRPRLSLQQQAATVVDVLRLCFTEAGARACCSSKVERIVPAGEAGEVRMPHCAKTMAAVGPWSAPTVRSRHSIR